MSPNPSPFIVDDIFTNHVSQPERNLIKVHSQGHEFSFEFFNQQVAKQMLLNLKNSSVTVSAQTTQVAQKFINSFFL